MGDGLHEGCRARVRLNLRALPSVGWARESSKAGAHDALDSLIALSVLAFALVARLLTVTPGLDTMLVLRSAIAGGPRAGLLAALGVNSGVLAWALGSAVGISALAAASSVAFDGLRLAGAAYLVWIGTRTLWKQRHVDATEWRGGAEGAPPPLSVAEAYRNGLLTNLLNPKIGVFYMTLLPQFIPHGAPVIGLSLLLATIHNLEGLIWFTLIILLATRLRRMLIGVKVRRRLEQISGLIFIGFGLRLAAERL